MDTLAAIGYDDRHRDPFSLSPVFAKAARAMTLEPYSPEKLDQFALGLLDLAAILRKMANDSREHGITDLSLHDKKAQDWFGRLDHWAHKVQAEVQMQIVQARASRRASTVDLHE